MVGLFANIGQTFGYSARNTFLRPLFWLGLIITAIIAVFCIAGGFILLGMGMWYLSIILWAIAVIIDLFYMGLVVKIYGNKPLTFKGFFGSVGRGFQYLVISIIYAIIVAIVFGICSLLGVFGTTQLSLDSLMAQIQAGNFSSLDSLTNISTTLFPNGVTAVGVIMLVVFILVALFFFILKIAALVNFARAGKFGAAFHFGEIFKRIGFLGILKFIVAIIFFIIIMAVLLIVFSFIFGLLLVIPVPILNVVLAIIFAALVCPFLGVFGIKYFSNLFGDE